MHTLGQKIVDMGFVYSKVDDPICFEVDLEGHQYTLNEKMVRDAEGRLAPVARVDSCEGGVIRIFLHRRPLAANTSNHKSGQIVQRWVWRYSFVFDVCSLVLSAEVLCC